MRCGWAWGTPYAGDEEAAGIDALGFLSDAEMLAEMRSWRAMVVPILRTTGVNTKLLPALQWSVPLVLTSIAASPVGIPLDGRDAGRGGPSPPPLPVRRLAFAATSDPAAASEGWPRPVPPTPERRLRRSEARGRRRSAPQAAPQLEARQLEARALPVN